MRQRRDASSRLHVHGMKRLSRAPDVETDRIDGAPGPGERRDDRVFVVDVGLDRAKMRIIAIEQFFAALGCRDAIRTEKFRSRRCRMSQLFRWRQQLCHRGAAQGFAAVAVAPPALPGGMIEVEFGSDVRLRISGPIDAATVSAAITALARGEQRR